MLHVSGAPIGGAAAAVRRLREDGHRIRFVTNSTTRSRAQLAEQLRDKLGESVVLVASASDGKAQLVLTVSKPLTHRLKAADLIRPIAELVGGSGGGRPDMAQAGGTEPAKLDDAVEAVYGAVGSAL